MRVEEGTRAWGRHGKVRLEASGYRRVEADVRELVWCWNLYSSHYRDGVRGTSLFETGPKAGGKKVREKVFLPRFPASSARASK